MNAIASPNLNDQTPSFSNYPPEFIEVCRYYPRRLGNDNKRKAYRAWSARIKSGENPGKLIEGAKGYAVYVRNTNKENTPYVMMMATFFGPDLHYLDYSKITSKPVSIMGRGI